MKDYFIKLPTTTTNSVVIKKGKQTEKNLDKTWKIAVYCGTEIIGKFAPTTG